MTPQERDVIGGIFDRLRQAETQPRDPQAEGFIAERLKTQPYAPYVLAQTVFAQEQAINSLTQRIQELEAQLKQAQQAPPPSGGFLSSIFGGAQPQPQAAPPPLQRPMAPPAGPWGAPPPLQQPMGYPPQQPMGYPQQQPMGYPQAQQPSQMGSFLRTAAGAAVGVAGGMMVANALSHAFSGNNAGNQQLSSLGLEPVMSTGAFSDPSIPDPGFGSGTGGFIDAGQSSSGAGMGGFFDNGQSNQGSNYSPASYDDSSFNDSGSFDDSQDV